MAKKKHTYNIGDIVKFKFLTGDILVGKVTEHTYKDDGTPTYKIRVEENSKSRKGFTIYPCMTDSRIINLEQTALNAVKALNKKEKAAEKKSIPHHTPQPLGLDEQIKKQRDFLNGEI